MASHKITQTTMSTQTGNDAAISALEQRNKELVEENERLKKKCKDYEFNMRQFSKAMGGDVASRGKTKGRALVGVEEGLKAPLITLGIYFLERIWPKVKFLPDGWEMWNENENFVCYKICKK